MSNRKLELSQHFRTQDFKSKSQLTKIEWKTISWSLLKLMSIESVRPSNHLVLCHPPLLLPSIFPSIRVFSNESALRIRWPKYWSFSISPSNEYSGLISFRMDGLISMQSKGLSRVFYSITKTSVLQRSAFFMVQLSHLCMITGKPELWLYGPLLAKRWLCFLSHCLGLSQLFFQEASVFWFHGCSHHLQWYWGSGK